MDGSSPHPAPRLRLVHAGVVPAPTPQRRVEAENVKSASLPASDARAVFAADVSGRLGAGALLRPADRRRLVAKAVGMGIREFDANLVIAIVQDHARSGLGGPADRDPRLGLIAAANPGPGPAGLLGAAICLGVLLAAVYITFLGG